MACSVTTTNSNAGNWERSNTGLPLGGRCSPSKGSVGRSRVAGIRVPLKAPVTPIPDIRNRPPSGKLSVSQPDAPVSVVDPSTQGSKFLEPASPSALSSWCHASSYSSAPWDSPNVAGSTTTYLEGCLWFFSLFFNQECLIALQPEVSQPAWSSRWSFPKVKVHPRVWGRLGRFQHGVLMDFLLALVTASASGVSRWWSPQREAHAPQGLSLLLEGTPRPSWRPPNV